MRITTLETNSKEVAYQALEAAPEYPGLVLGPFEPADSQDKGHDGFLTAQFQGAQTRFLVEVRGRMHSGMIHRLIEGANSQAMPVLVVTTYVPAVFAELLKKAGVNFLDVAGNAHIVIGDLHIFTTGKRPTLQLRSSKTGRVFQRNGLMLVFAALTDPELDRDPDKSLLSRPFREIGGRASVSLGSIGAIIGELEEDGYLLEESSRQRRLVGRRKLFEKWVTAYTELLRPRLIRQRYHSDVSNWWQSVKLSPDNALWGGEVAAAKMTGYLKPQIVTIYSNNLSHSLIIDNDLRVDTEGDVEILTPFWRHLPYAKWEDCTHPLLVYADLCASGIDRNLETAQRVYDKFLRQLLEAH